MTRHCCHRGDAVQVGQYEILAGGTRDLEPEDLKKADILIPLTGDSKIPWEFGSTYQVLAAPLVDFGGVPKNWRQFLLHVIGELERGKSMLVFCVGSHGRTGTFLASLIALLESEEETPDPIRAVRERHCSHAVETLAQAEAIFALRGQEVPDEYVEAFRSHRSFGAYVPLEYVQPDGADEPVTIEEGKVA